MRLTRRFVLVLACASAFVQMPAQSQPSYPDRPVTLVVPFPPGGSIDLMARILANGLSTKLGKAVVVENRAGAGGTLATGAVVSARPDGYTLLFGTAGGLAVAPAVNSNLKYDPIRDFAAIAHVGDLPYALLVNSKSPITDLASLRKEAAERRDGLNFGSHGVGAFNHLLGETLNGMLDSKMTHVPFRGSAPAFQSLMAGDIQVLLDTLPGAAPFLSAQGIKAIAVTSSTRSVSHPEIPTVAEFGLPQLLGSTWAGVLAPAGTPAPIVNFLNREINDTLTSAAMKDQFAKLGVQVRDGSPQAFADFIAGELQRWSAVAKMSKITAE
jgi:tripartite-type tricarboxylate transporter receptor subunit TctC